MVKVQLHYKHIAVAVVVVLCITLLTITILHDIYSKKGTIDTNPANPSEDLRAYPVYSNLQEDALLYELFRDSDQVEAPQERNYVPNIPPNIDLIRQRMNNPAPQRSADLFQKLTDSFAQQTVTPSPQRFTDSQPQRYFDPDPPRSGDIAQNLINSFIQKMADPSPQRTVSPVPQINTPILQTTIAPPKLPLTADDSSDSLTRFVQAKLQDVKRNPNDNYYVAAVIDFQPLAVGDVATKARWNTDQYVEVIRECEKYTVDIVVFPETGIFQIHDSKISILNQAPQVPPVEAEAVPCDKRDYGEILTKLSCAAKNSKMYVSVMLMERSCMENTACSLNDLKLYFTNVVFDRSGKIVARYRKYNLYVERWFPGIDAVLEAELVAFTTDFNVTFGVISCFDILFKHPALTLLNKHGVTDILYPTTLMTRLPFIAASTVPAGWSFALNVNVLSARTSDLFGVAGNNVFYGRRESTQTYMTDYGFHTIVIAPVPKGNAPFPQNFADPFFALSKYYNSKKHYSYLIEHSVFNIKMEPLFNQQSTTYEKTFKYVTEDFFCNVSVTWEATKNTFSLPGYRTAGYAGLTNYSLASVNNYVEMCGLMLCSWTTNLLCLLPPNFDDSAKVTISSLRVVTASRAATSDVRIPIAMKSDLTALDPMYFQYKNAIKDIKGKKYNAAEISLRKPISNLVSFGIYKLPDKINPSTSHSVLDVMLNTDTVIG